MASMQVKSSCLAVCWLAVLAAASLPSVQSSYSHNCTEDEWYDIRDFGSEELDIYVHGVESALGNQSAAVAVPKPRSARAVLNGTDIDDDGEYPEDRLPECGLSRRSACKSLGAAFHQVPKYCVPKLTTPFPWGVPRTIAKCENGCITRVILMARKPSCEVVVGGTNLTIRNSRELMLHFVKDNESDCEYATLVFDDAFTQSWVDENEDNLTLHASLEIRNSSNIAFKHVRVLPARNRTALAVIDSVRVTFEDVIFESDNRQHSLEILSSIDVHIYNVTFRNFTRETSGGMTNDTAASHGQAPTGGAPLDDPPTEKSKSALYISHNNSMLLSDTDIWMAVSGFRYVCEEIEKAIISKCEEQRREEFTNGRPSIFLLNVTFWGLQARRVSLEQGSGQQQAATEMLWQQTGTAVEAHFLDRTKTAYVLFKNCVVQHVSLEAGVLHTSPVFVRYATDKPPPANLHGRVQSAVFSSELNSVEFENCEFTDNAGYLGGVLHVSVEGNRRLTVFNSLAVSNSRLLRNRAVLEGAAIFVHMTGILQASNIVVISRCRLEDNIAGSHDKPTAGGALYLMSDSRADKQLNLKYRLGRWFPGTYAPVSGRCDPRARSYRPAEINHVRYSVTLDNCEFINNVGLGAVHSRVAQVSFEGNTTFLGNRGSALVAMNSNITISGRLKMANNSGQIGAAMHVAEFGSIRMTGVDVDHFIVENNSATAKGGAFIADIVSSTQSNDERLLHLGRSRQLSQCPLQFPKNLSYGIVERLLLTNKVKALDQSGFYVGSWQKCFGILSIIDHPASSTNNHTLDFCTPFNIFDGWTLPCQGEDTDTGELDQQMNITRKLNTGQINCSDFTKVVQAWLKSVRALDLHAVLTELGVGDDQGLNRTSQCPRRISKPPDSAVLRSAFQRPLSAFVSRDQAPICKSKFSDSIVLNELDLYKTKFSTDAAWLFFNSTTTSCYKRIGNKVWYFRGDCQRTQIYQFAQSYNESRNSLQLLSSTDFSLVGLAVKHYRFRASSVPVLPGPRLTLTPWSDALQNSEDAFDLHMEDTDEDVPNDKCAEEKASLTRILLQSYSDLILHPAPGEVFDLDIIVTDELLNVRSATLSIKVKSKNGDVLLGHDDHQYSPDEFVLFSTGQTNWALSLLGLPGSEGYLTIKAEGDYNQRPSADEQLELRIPFRLRNCHFGFDQPIIRDLDQAQRYVDDLTRCRKDKTLANCSQLSSGSTQLSRLTCRCPRDRQGVKDCELGRRINIRSDYWAGFWENKLQTEVWQRKHISEYRTGEFRQQDRDPFGRYDNDFKIAPCNGLCSDHGRNTSWPLDEVSPCNTDMGRVGPLCGMCKDNTYVLVSSEWCKPCDQRLYGGIGLYVIIVIMVTALVFFVLVYLEVRVTATLDSWLFFMQAVFCLYPDNLIVGAISYNSLTYGLGQLCLSKQLQRIEAKMLLVIQPGVLFTMLGTFKLLEQTAVGIRMMDWLSKGRESERMLPRVLWLCVLYSSSSLAYVALTMLTCVNLDNHGLKVLFVDGSVECFNSVHQPYAVFSILILMLLILPPLVILVVAPNWSRSKRGGTFVNSFIDIAKSIYRRRYHTWPAISLGRRLMFAVFLTVITDGPSRRLAMTIHALVLLALHAVFKPYKKEAKRRLFFFSDINNTFEAFILLDLSILGVLRLVVSDFGIDDPRQFAQTAVYPLYAAPTVIILALLAEKLILRLRARSKSQASPGSSGDSAYGDSPEEQGKHHLLQHMAGRHVDEDSNEESDDGQDDADTPESPGEHVPIAGNAGRGPINRIHGIATPLLMEIQDISDQ
ncbi:uncharacterized protein LOC135828439 isoform X2 [Sycon ciliatum]|uniref:uncharacterized protein LOC135828439 isoform X2 n=1 Tax=Sycon ciliatum TaxID=27933 RepID=UPI0020ADC6D0